MPYPSADVVLQPDTPDARARLRRYLAEFADSLGRQGPWPTCTSAIHVRIGGLDTACQCGRLPPLPFRATPLERRM